LGFQTAKPKTTLTRYFELVALFGVESSVVFPPYMKIENFCLLETAISELKTANKVAKPTILFANLNYTLNTLAL
jgi:hypothetical protein